MTYPRRWALAGLLAVCSCHSLNRLGHISPLGDFEDTAERVNLWPLYYQAGEARAVLWPLFDTDAEGFALRPLITNQNEEWEFLPPVAWWDAETGHWIVVPFYSFENHFGLFPLIGVGSLSYVGPLWYDDEGSGGLFPLAAVGGEWNWVGPAWWHREDKSVASWGLFPLVSSGANFTQIGPVVWGTDPDTDEDYLLAVPFLWRQHDAAGNRMWISPLGGSATNAAGDEGFVNVLGPVFHHEYDSDETTNHVLWPLIEWRRGVIENSWHAWPLAGHVRNQEFHDYRTWALAGLIEAEGYDEVEGLRVWPLFSVQSAATGSPGLLHELGLVGYKAYNDKMSDLHIGTPLVFNYHKRPDGRSWNALLKVLDY